MTVNPGFRLFLTILWFPPFLKIVLDVKKFFLHLKKFTVIKKMISAFFILLILPTISWLLMIISYRLQMKIIFHKKVFLENLAKILCRMKRKWARAPTALLFKLNCYSKICINWFCTRQSISDLFIRCRWKGTSWKYVIFLTMRSIFRQKVKILGGNLNF